MRTKQFSLAIRCAVLGSFGFCVLSQNPNPIQVPTSVNANLILDAAGSEQRKSLGSIYLIACPDVGNSASVGTDFLLDNGVIVTNSHVVSTCTEQTLFGISIANQKITFSRIVKDADRDLALLVPVGKLSNGLKLNATDSPEPGLSVTTWGYPFAYNGVSPLLSVGYISGFREAKSESGRSVKHIVINGAFNHGNSGGPLLLSRDNEVIGIVVLTYNFYPPGLKKIIDQLATQQSGMQWTMNLPGGGTKNVSETQITAAILDEFYQKTQVMIGEAIAASELAAMIKEHAAEIPPVTAPPLIRAHVVRKGKSGQGTQIPFQIRKGAYPLSSKTP